MKNNIKTREQVQEEMVEKTIEGQFQGILHVTMRVGKSKVIIDSLDQVKDKWKTVLWVTETVKLRDVDIPQEFIKWGKEDLLERVDICCWRSLSKVYKDYDIVILDECQNITEKALEYFRPRRQGPWPRILAMTGHLPKGKEKRHMLYNDLSLSILYEYTQDEAIQDRVISDYDLKVLLVPLSEKKDFLVKRQTASDYYTSEKSRENVLSNNVDRATFSGKKRWAKIARLNRMRFLHGLPSKVELVKRLLQKTKGRYLIFGPTKKVIDQITDKVFYSTTDPKKAKEMEKNYQAFKNGALDHLGVVNKVSTGHTFEDIDGCIIMGADNNLNGILSQKAARTLVFRKDHKAVIYLLTALGTQEEKWLEKTLESFEDDKVTIIHPLKNNLLEK